MPRHIFVDEALAHRAYEDIALPIGFGQTISNPWVVARMLELMRAGQALGKVLEIGTGCGYQAALLSRLAREVYSVERLSPLLMKARVKLRELGVNNVRFKHADGSLGLKDVAPFDGILMAAAAPAVPDALREQLAPGWPTGAAGGHAPAAPGADRARRTGPGPDHTRSGAIRSASAGCSALMRTPPRAREPAGPGKGGLASRCALLPMGCGGPHVSGAGGIAVGARRARREGEVSATGARAASRCRS